MITIKQNAGNVSVQFPQSLVDNDYVEKFVAYLRFAEKAAKNKMKKADAVSLSEDIKADWWKANKNTFLKKINK